MAIDPSIAMGYRGLGELPNPINQLAQVSQIQSSQRQGEMAQMQIQQMRRDETALTQFYADVAKNGGPTNPVEIEDAMIKSGVRNIVNSGLTARLTRSKLENQQKQFAGIMNARMPTGAPMAAPAAAAVPEPGSFSEDVATRTAAIPAFARGGNALISEQTPRVNALGGGGANNAAEIAFKQQQRDAFIGMGTTQSIAAAKAINADIALLARKPSYQNVRGVGLVNLYDMSVVMPLVEPKATSVKELEAFIKMTPPEQETFLRIKRNGAASTVTNVKLPPAETAYAQTFATEVAKNDQKLLELARNAPTVMATANRVMRLLDKPDIFVGPAADVKLKLARALNVLGADETEAMRNTEKLIAAAGQSTLDAIKGANLGTGQGFTAKDLDFLTNVAGGTIKFTAENLREMARLQQIAAERSVTKWLTRRPNMPESALKGTGIDTERYELEPKVSSGGNDAWVRDAKGNVVKQQAKP